MAMTDEDIEKLSKTMIEEAIRLATTEQRRYVVGMFIDMDNQDFSMEAVPESEGIKDSRITPAWIITEGGDVLACDKPATT